MKTVYKFLRFYEEDSRGRHEQRENYVNNVIMWHNFTHTNISTNLQRVSVISQYPLNLEFYLLKPNRQRIYHNFSQVKSEIHDMCMLDKRSI